MNYVTKKSLLSVWKVASATFNGFLDDKGLKLSASLAYYTVFSIAPLLILLISLASFFYGQDAIQGRVFSQVNAFVGNEAAAQIQSMIKSVSLSGKTGVAVVTGIITLILGASGVFLEIQESLNIIWRVKAKPKRGWVKMITNRLLSFSLIIGLGFLLIVSLIVNGVIIALSDRLTHYFPNATLLVLNVINLGLTFIVISALFGIIFKFLPDVNISWKGVRMGAFFTALLFMLGKYLIGIYITTTGTGSTYGAAGSLIVILVWIYYTSAILYFGAEFTQVYAEFTGCKIQPAEYAVAVIQKEVEKEVTTLPLQNPDLK